MINEKNSILTKSRHFYILNHISGQCISTTRYFNNKLELSVHNFNNMKQCSLHHSSNICQVMNLILIKIISNKRVPLLHKAPITLRIRLALFREVIDIFILISLNDFIRMITRSTWIRFAAMRLESMTSSSLSWLRPFIKAGIFSFTLLAHNSSQA